MIEINVLEFILSNYIVVCYRFFLFDLDVFGWVCVIGSGNIVICGERNWNLVFFRKVYENRYDFNIYEKLVKNVIFFIGRLKKLIIKLFSIFS